MSKRTISSRIESVTIDEQFLIDLFKIINRAHPKRIRIDTEITIFSERDEVTYENLREFTSSQIWPKKIDGMCIKKKARKKSEREKVIEFTFNIDTKDIDESYYELIGYEDGKLASCKEKIEGLLDRYKNWYSFIFKFRQRGEHDEPSNGLRDSIPFVISISLAFLLYRLLNLIPKEVIKEYSGAIAFVSWFFFMYYCGKLFEQMFPYMDLQIKKKRRSEFFRGIMGLIVLGLVINLIWEIIRLALKP